MKDVFIILTMFACLFFVFYVGAPEDVIASSEEVGYLTIIQTNNSSISRSDTVSFEGKASVSTNQQIRLDYSIESPTGVVVRNNQLIQTYTPSFKTHYFSHSFVVGSEFTDHGYYKVTVNMKRASNNAVLFSDHFYLLFEDNARPLTPNASVSLVGGQQRLTLGVKGTESDYFLPIILQYQLENEDQWLHYSSPVLLPHRTARVDYRACSSSGKCSERSSLPYSPTGLTSIPRVSTGVVLKIEDRRFDTFFINFNKRGVTNYEVPIPNGIFP